MDAQFYKGRENDVFLQLFNDGVLVTPEFVTKIEFRYNGGSFNSTDNPDLFSFEATGIRLKFGASTVPSGIHQMMMVVYSSDHPNGIVWYDKLTIGLADG